MAAAFRRAGFDAVDVHMTDMLAGRRPLARVCRSRCLRRFLLRRRARCRRWLGQVDPVQCRAGAGRVCRSSLRARDTLHARCVQRLPDAVGAGRTDSRCRRTGRVSVQNRSGQFEARLSLVEVLPSRSVLLDGHGRQPAADADVAWRGPGEFAARRSGRLRGGAQVAIRYIDNRGRRPTPYPANPNGSPGGIAGLCSSRRPGHDPDAAPERVQRDACSTPGIRPAGATMGRGCACSGTRGCLPVRRRSYRAGC